MRKVWVWVAGLVVLLAAFVAYEWFSLPDAASVATANPETTAVMRDRASAKRRQYWVPLEAIAPQAVNAVLLSEDAAFWTHGGVDYDELKKAATDAWREGQLGRGASTITQQLAKNLWLGSERSLLRKAKEVVLARRLEKELPKKRILSLYLNVAEWGDGVYGIEAGAREQFGVSASALSVAQGAVLASMLPAPRKWSARAKTPILKQRAEHVVDLLAQYGRIGAGEAAAAHAEIEAMFGAAPAPSSADAGVEDDSAEGD